MPIGRIGRIGEGGAPGIPRGWSFLQLQAGVETATDRQRITRGTRMAGMLLRMGPFG